jgi:glycosyltransferase involved in cell wall biosynthesis
MEEKKISIIIPSYNSQDTMKYNLDALGNQKTDVSYEVIVVDCSPHDKVEKLCLQYDFVRYNHEKNRFSPGIGRNIGSSLANGDLLIFIDSDVILNDSVLERIGEYYQQGYKIFGGALELSDKSPNAVASLLEHSFYNHESQKNRPPKKRKNLSSAFLVIEKELFDSAGKFKDIPRMQDTEFTERIGRTGVDIYFFPDIIAFQIQDSSITKVFRKIYIGGVNLPAVRYGDRGIVKTLFFICLLPLIALAKSLRIILRNLRYGTHTFKELIISPLILAGGFVWMIGFYEGVLFNRGISKNR